MQQPLPRKWQAGYWEIGQGRLTLPQGHDPVRTKQGVNTWTSFPENAHVVLARTQARSSAKLAGSH